MKYEARNKTKILETIRSQKLKIENQKLKLKARK